MLDAIRDRLTTNTNPGEDTAQAAVEDVSVDGVLDVLSNSRRRIAIDYLVTHDEREITLRDLSEYVAAVENDTTPDKVDAQARKSVYVVLYQNHIPALAAAGVIEHDDRQNLLSATPETHTVASILETVRSHVNGGGA